MTAKKTQRGPLMTKALKERPCAWVGNTPVAVGGRLSDAEAKEMYEETLKTGARVIASLVKRAKR